MREIDVEREARAPRLERELWARKCSREEDVKETSRYRMRSLTRAGVRGQADTPPARSRRSAGYPGRGTSVDTHPHARDLAVRRGRLPGPADREKEEGQEVEYVREGGVEAVVVRGVVIADLVQARYCGRADAEESKCARVQWWVGGAAAQHDISRTIVRGATHLV